MIVLAHDHLAAEGEQLSTVAVWSACHAVASARVCIMEIHGVDLSFLTSPEQTREFADTLVTHAVYGAMGGLIGFLDEDMLWLSHAEPAWIAVVSETALQRAVEALSAVDTLGLGQEDVAWLLPPGLGTTTSLLPLLVEYRIRSLGGRTRFDDPWLRDWYDHVIPDNRPLLLDDLGWDLKCSLEWVLRSLVEIVAACHRLVVGPQGNPAQSYARCHPDRRNRGEGQSAAVVDVQQDSAG